MRVIAANSASRLLHTATHQLNSQTPPTSFLLLTKNIDESLSSLLLKKSHTNSQSHIHEARKLHALLLVGDFLNPNAPPSSWGSRLVQVYVRLGSLKEALLVFRSLHRVNNVACNSIIRAYVDSALFSRAIHFFNQLITERSFVPDNHTCPLILKGCSRLGDLEEGRKVRNVINSFSEVGSLIPNGYTKCAMVDMFAKCGSLDEARMVFDEMPEKERDLASWTALICGTIHQGHGVEALSLFKMMRFQGTSPDSNVVAAILPACGRFEAKRQTGIALQGFSIRSGFECDLFVSNALIDMYCKFKDVDEAYKIFFRMMCKDVVSWTTLIGGYSQNCLYNRSLDMYKEMINEGVKPSEIAVASILPAFGKLNLLKEGKVMHCYVIKQGFDFDIVIGSALMDMYSNCGLTDEMETLFSNWSDRDVMIWNSMIIGHATAGNFDRALSIFRKIWDSRFKPNEITFGSVLPIITKIGAVKQGEEVHGHVIRNSFIMAGSVSNSIIDMYCKCGYLGLGAKVFDQMLEKDVISYNTVISAYGFCGYGKQALALFNEMKSLGIKPSKVTFVGLLSACSHTGLIDEGWSLYNSMVNYYGIRPNMEHYSCMVDMLGRAGRVDEACNFIKMMPEEPDGNVLGCLLNSLRVHNKMEYVGLVEEILQDKLDDSGYHILLANVYASINKWKDASRVRALIKEKGLRKKPGKSWIEIGHGTHVFDARDTSHPEFGEIQVVLERLCLEMKKEWHENIPLGILH